MRLSLYDTPITTIDDFSLPASLKFLILTKTKLTSLPKSLASLKNLDIVYLDYIPNLQCKCSDSYLAGWYQTRKQSGSITITGNCSNFAGSSIDNFLTNFNTIC